MKHKKLLFDLPEKEKKDAALKSKYIYGDSFRDRIAHESTALPRYAKLGRKVLSYYVGEKYNPHTIEINTEVFVRHHIKRFIQEKVFYKQKGYDWEFIDHYFKKVIGELLEIEIPYDMERLRQGIKTEDASLLDCGTVH